ncbi:MAG: (d)CMP kinase [Polyangiaceae bacterium]
MTRKLPVVAMDGPAGAGKSTVARMLAAELGFGLIDTGAIYRTVALAASRASLATSDAAAVTQLAEQLVERRAIALEGAKTILDGEDVSLAIRTPEMSLAASAVSAIPGVRAALLAVQRQLGANGGVVLEGRDIGTVVFPDAERKFYVTASIEVRAKRRYDELTAKGTEVSYEATLDDVRKRDEADSTRAVAPLKPAPDAEIIDTSTMSIEEVVKALAARVRSAYA